MYIYLQRYQYFILISSELYTTDTFTYLHNHVLIKVVYFTGVCDTPEWYSNLSHATPDITAHTADLQYTFKACYNPKDDLVNFHWLKDGQLLDPSDDEHYYVSHKQIGNLYVCLLKIRNTTVNDSGNYMCRLWYKKFKIDSQFVEAEGAIYLNISSM